MARPRRYGKRVQTVVRLDPETLETLRREASRRDVSANYLICSAVDTWLDLHADVTSRPLPGEVMS